MTMNLIGLAELAELYGVSKNTANTWSRQRDWPAPVITLKMGPVWDRDTILKHRPLKPRVTCTVSDPFGFFAVTVDPPDCDVCKIKTVPEPDSARIASDACGDVQVDYTTTCAECGGTWWPTIDYTQLQTERGK